jgi:hypothetical protein
MDQNKSPQINLHIYGQLIFNKKHTWGRTVSLVKSIGKTGYLLKKNEIRPLVHSIYKHTKKKNPTQKE